MHEHWWLGLLFDAVARVREINLMWSHPFVWTHAAGTIGTVAVGDINGDDYADIVVPLFKDSTVAVYSFMPTEH